MSDKGRIIKNPRYAITLAIVVVICLLLSDCAHSLRSALNNGSSTLPSVEQKRLDSAVPDKTGTPLLAVKEEPVLPTNNGHDRLNAFPKDGHRQNKKLATSSSSPTIAAPPIRRKELDDNPEPRQELSPPNNPSRKKAKTVVEEIPSTSATREAKGTTASTTTPPPNSHQGDFESNVNKAFGETFTEPTSGMEFILVKGGCYQMGSSLRAFEGPVHEVCVDDFYLSKHEVTQRQWKILMGRDFSYFKGNGRPVERITWDDSQRFIHQLNSRGSAVYRLPTEAEWEYAARSGGEDKLYAGTSDEKLLPHFAWHQVNSNRQTHMVGVKKPNSLGLYDMSGNVWEWCSDWYDDSYYANSSLNNPQGPNNGIYRVIRGGEWELPAGLSRTTYREAAKPNVRRSDIGFRLALTPPK